MTILSLLLFFIALGVLITIHELGHFIAAKSFNVFCSDFSIGFGPKIVKYKRKNGETRFSLGIIPLGGYVQMYGEETDDPEANLNIPKERSLDGISRWKKIIIFSAGVIMNFILAYLIFFISAVSSPQLTSDVYLNVVQVVDENKFNESIKLSDGTPLTQEQIDSLDQRSFEVNVFQYDVTVTENGVSETRTLQLSNILNVKNTKIDGENEYFFVTFDTSNYGYNDTDYSQCFKVYKAFSSNEVPSNISNIRIYDNGNFIPLNYDFEYMIPLVENNSFVEVIHSYDALQFEVSCFDSTSQDNRDELALQINMNVNQDLTFEHIGLGMYTRFEWLGLRSFSYALDNWVDGTQAIFNALSQLFYDTSSWNNLGGPVAIFTQTTQILSHYPFSYYLNTWGLISVNLAIFNLLPFPGLDGWQILVELVEGSVNGIKKLTRKKKGKQEEVIENSDNTQVLEVEPIEGEESDSLVIGEAKEKKDKNNDGEWKIPPKVKNIVSFIGLILLFALMAVILIKDVINLF